MFLKRWGEGVEEGRLNNKIRNDLDILVKSYFTGSLMLIIMNDVIKTGRAISGFISSHILTCHHVA